MHTGQRQERNSNSITSSCKWIAGKYLGRMYKREQAGESHDHPHLEETQHIK